MGRACASLLSRNECGYYPEKLSNDPRQSKNMDVPLALNDIGIRTGFNEYIRKSSTFNRKADVVGLSVL
jgi:hypothetical protein